MKKTTLKLTSGILLSSLFLGNVSVVDIAKAEENKQTFESDNKNKNKNIATKVTSENGKNFLVLTATNDVKNINLTVKLGNQEKKFKHDEIKAGETIKFEIVLPEHAKSENATSDRVVNDAKTDATLVAGSDLARETLTTEVLVEGLKITTTVAYDVEASEVSVQAVSSSSEVAAPAVTSAAVVAPTTEVTTPATPVQPVATTQATQYPVVAPVVAATAAVATNVIAAPAATTVAPTPAATTRAVPTTAPQEVKPELKIISPDKAVAGFYNVAKPVATLPAAPVTTAPVTTAAPAPVVTTQAAPATTAAPAPVAITQAAPATTATPAPVVTTKAAPVTTAAPAPVVTTKAAPVTTAAPAPVVTTKAAPVTTAAPAPVVTTKAAPVTTAAPKPAVTTKAAPATTAAPKPAVTTQAAPATTVAPKPAAAPTKVMPFANTNYKITSPYGVSRNIMGVRDVHNGVDFVTNNNKESILATEAGVVSSAGVWNDGSNYVTIKHAPNSYTTYWHLAQNSITVKAGQKVTAGQKVGTIGTTGFSTGIHLHFMHTTSPSLSQSHKDPMKYLADATNLGKKTTAPVAAKTTTPAKPAATTAKKAAVTTAKPAATATTKKAVAPVKKATTTKTTTAKKTTR